MFHGLDWTQLAALEAGVTGVQTAGGQALRGFGAAISVSGARPDQNNYRLHGISINDYSNGAPGRVLGSNLGVDAVEQFSLSCETLINPGNGRKKFSDLPQIQGLTAKTAIRETGSAITPAR